MLFYFGFRGEAWVLLLQVDDEDFDEPMFLLHCGCFGCQ
jgi:hypothetical protein